MKKTTFLKQSELAPRWFLVDAKNQTLGRLATQLSMILRGKNKPSYTPHLLSGDYVVVINAKEVKLTGNKLTDKKMRWHSGYRTGLKEMSYDVLMQTKPTKAIEKAVFGMLPKNKLRTEMMARLKVFPGAEHDHEAQKPELIKLS